MSSQLALHSTIQFSRCYGVATRQMTSSNHDTQQVQFISSGVGQLAGSATALPPGKALLPGVSILPGMEPDDSQAHHSTCSDVSA